MPTVDQTYQHDVPVETLTPDPTNPNVGDVGAISQSIEALGFFGAIIAVPDKRRKGHGRIVAGEHRWRAAVALGETTVPVIWVNTTAEKARRMLIADNRYAQLGVMDPQKLADLLQVAASEKMGLAGTGFDGDDLDLLMADLEAAKHSSYGTATVARTPGERTDEYVGKGIRSLVIPLPEEAYLSTVRKLSDLRDTWGVKSHADVILRLLDEHDG